MRYALLFCLVLVLGVVLLAGSAAAAVRINEILAAPSSDWDGDLGSDSKDDEWVEIANDGAVDADISALVLLNGDGRAPVYGFSGLLGPGAHLVIYGTDAVSWESAEGYSTIGLSLNNSGDVLRLASVAGGDTTIVDSLVFTSSQAGYDVSLGRLPDQSGSWTLFDHFAPTPGDGGDPTPGLSNSANAEPHVLEITRTPVYPTQDDTVRIAVMAGDASGIAMACLGYQINLEDGEEPEMTLVSGTRTLGTWAYAIPPCAPDDTVRYRVLLVDDQTTTLTAWAGYRVRSGGLTVRLNEILADPPSDAVGDANNDGVRDSADDEFIELVNCGSAAVDLAGWKLSDATSVRHTFPDTGMVVSPGEYVTVFGGGSPAGFVGKVSVASTGGLSLSNTGDAVSLLDRSGELVDIISFGSEGGRDEALGRYPDCSGDWVLPSDVGITTPFSPQQPNGETSAISPSTWGGLKSLFK